MTKTASYYPSRESSNHLQRLLSSFKMLPSTSPHERFIQSGAECAQGTSLTVSNQRSCCARPTSHAGTPVPPCVAPHQPRPEAPCAAPRMVRAWRRQRCAQPLQHRPCLGCRPSDPSQRVSSSDSRKSGAHTLPQTQEHTRSLLRSTPRSCAGAPEVAAPAPAE